MAGNMPTKYHSKSSDDNGYTPHMITGLDYTTSHAQAEDVKKQPRVSAVPTDYPMTLTFLMMLDQLMP
ncbi:MAG: hypothetical protein NZM12_10270 [Steroidobacteraceae bacterium]|nr:hypothetical protein [Steroidobacteraceae bacterium]